MASASLTIRKLMPLGTSTTALVLTLAFALRVTPAFAVHAEGIFQLDGDAKASICSGSGPGIPSSRGRALCMGEVGDNPETCTGSRTRGPTRVSAHPAHPR